MLKKISVRNYRSFAGEEGQFIDVPLRKFNAIIGPNNSGKSNFLKLLSSISSAVGRGTVEVPIGDEGGYESLIFDGRTELDLELTVEAEVNGRKAKYNLTVNSEKETTDELFLEGEKIIDYANPMEGRYLTKDEEWKNFTIGYSKVRLSATDDTHPVQEKFLSLLRDIHVLNLSISKMRETLDIRRELFTGDDGSSLTKVMHTLYTGHPKIFKELQKIVSGSIPELEKIKTPPTEAGEATIKLVEEGLSKEIDLSEMSDGTLTLIGYLSILLSPKQPSLICIEEPESYIHPHLMGPLTDIFKSTETQVITTTKSPYFLDFLNPEDLLIFEKERGRTRCRRIEKQEADELRRTMKEDGLTLGELWYSKGMGGVP